MERWWRLGMVLTGIVCLSVAGIPFFIWALYFFGEDLNTLVYGVPFLLLCAGSFGIIKRKEWARRLLLAVAWLCIVIVIEFLCGLRELPVQYYEKVLLFKLPDQVWYWFLLRVWGFDMVLGRHEARAQYLHYYPLLIFAGLLYFYLTRPQVRKQCR